MSGVRLLITDYKLSSCLEAHGARPHLQYQKCFRDEETGNVVFQYMRSQLVTVSFVLCCAAGLMLFISVTSAGRLSSIAATGHTFRRCHS